jgi:hypothetical protein
MLAGPSSESDEFADVGFWCGDIDENNKENSILEALSLGSWTQKGTVSLRPRTFLPRVHNEPAFNHLDYEAG